MASILGIISSFFSGIVNAYNGLGAWSLGFATSIIMHYGGLGVLVGMFLESSVVPIPSEIVLITAGALGVSPIDAAIYGAIGSTLGAIVGYFIGLHGGRPVVDKYGPYIFVTKERVASAERKFNEWGKSAVLIGRLIPFLPFKVFSITSGLLAYDLKNFIIFTFIGTVPRAFLLAWLGQRFAQYSQQLTLVVIAIVVLVLAWVYLKPLVFKAPQPQQQQAPKGAEKKRK